MYNKLLKCLRFKYLLICVFITFLIGCFLSLHPFPSGDICPCGEKSYRTAFRGSSNFLGVVVPFRDRYEELMEFAPHMYNFLTSQKINFRIFVVNQVDHYRFNRASLINVGFTVALAEGCDYIAMHDVDLLPLNSMLSYAYPKNGVYHISSPELHPLYHYPKFVGGILLITSEDFKSVNGMSNKYWGWGMEDDEFYVRLKMANINIIRPINMTTDFQNTFRHIHDKRYRKRDMAKCYNQKEVLRRPSLSSGLRDLSYTIQSRKRLVIEGAPLVVINTELHCNRTQTPWCLCSESNKAKGKPMPAHV